MTKDEEREKKQFFKDQESNKFGLLPNNCTKTESGIHEYTYMPPVPLGIGGFYACIHCGSIK